jgi:allograft inflammatory factor 1
MDHQGGKQFGALKKQQELSLDEVNKAYLADEDYQDEEEFPDFANQLEAYKKQFMSFDLDNSGDIDLFELKMLMEKLDQAKTHLELKKMIAENDRENRGSISYNDFVHMMVGKKNSIFKMILMFEKKMQETERPTGVAPKRSLDSLP